WGCSCGGGSIVGWRVRGSEAFMATLLPLGDVQLRVRKPSAAGMVGGMRLSLLDRANALVGVSESATLQEVVQHAREAEELGFHRFLVAEHHAVPGLPGSQPGMLAVACAAATQRIRIGTAGIMLPDHQPLIVAEQIATLEALHPGRIDAGIGSS